MCGIDASIVNARFAKPLDAELILDVANRTQKIITVEENVLSGGFGAAVLELLEKSSIPDVEVRRLGIPDEFVEHGKQSLLRSSYHLDAEGIAEQVIAFFPEFARDSLEKFDARINSQEVADQDLPSSTSIQRWSGSSK